MLTEEEFLAAPVEIIAAVAPRSMVYAPGGTRRSATFAGIKPWSEEYIRVGQEEYMACLEIIFRYGVENVFMPTLMATHTSEVGTTQADAIEQRLILPMARLATNARLLAACREHGWRLRIAPSAYHASLQPYLEILEKNTPTNAKHTWWMTFTPSHESWWSHLFAVVNANGVATRGDAIRVLYGEEIPPISLCISFGKLTVSPDLFPPLLMDTIHCYWSQQVGSSLTDAQFRHILYDYAFLRQTWQQDKIARAKEAEIHREIWQRDVLVGLGQRLGPFWYPRFPDSIEG
jgi:hypothetical protein